MKTFSIFFYLILGFLFTSCALTEEITINPDGSGNYKFNIDMSSMMSMMSGLDSVQPEKFQKYDSIINFKDLLDDKKDDISKMSDQEKEIIESLKDMKMSIHMDEEQKIFLMDMMLDFQNINEITNMQEKIAKAQELQKNELTDKKEVRNNDVSYTYSPKSFRRNVKMLKLSKEDQAIYDENIEQYKMYLAGTMYKIKYNFPQVIKEYTLQDAVLSEDGKTLIYEIPIDSVFANPKILDFEVKF